MLLFYFLAFFLALILSLIFTPVVRLFALRWGFVDRPSERKIHKKPVPLFGGLAIILSLYVCFVVFILLGKIDIAEYVAFIVGSSLVLALGLWDALFGTQPYVKMAVLFLIGLIVVLLGQIILISPVTAINMIFSVFWFAGITNAFNYLDNMDGLAASLAFVSSVLFFAVILLTNQPSLSYLALILAGATLGFLKYNFNPASVFMGDIGSYFIGFVLSLIGARIVLTDFWDLALNLHISSLQTISFIVPILILGIPIFDTFLVTVLRPLARRKIVQAGKDHSSHRLHNLGFSQKATVVILGGVQIVLGACAIALLRANVEQFFALLVVILVMVAFCWLFLARVKVYA